MEISGQVSLLAVADGHGSDACPYSRDGAEIAVEAFCSVMERLVEKNFTENSDKNFFLSYLNRDGSLGVARLVEQEWKQRVWESYLTNHGGQGESDTTDRNSVYRLYGSTLLGLLLMEDYLFAFQIGDGDILPVDADRVQPLTEADKILGTETHSISSENAWKNAVTSVRRQEDHPRLYLLSTDGFCNSYPTTESFKETCRDYYNVLREYGFQAVTDNLKDWLTETSDLGSGDDITLLLAYTGDEECAETADSRAEERRDDISDGGEQE
ncbi:MAG: protein phosphatase 2C domain-containing protein [Clostridiales bacterium]|nr:protein phosphatase 2C domain-containing protein [Clostridiales bacterium]